MFDLQITDLLNQAFNFGLLSEEDLQKEFMISHDSLNLWRRRECLPQGSFRTKLIKILRENEEKINQNNDRIFVKIVKSLRTLVSDEEICQHFKIPSSTLRDWDQGNNLPKDEFLRGRVCGFF